MAYRLVALGGQPLLADAGGQVTSVGPIQVASVSTVAATLGVLSLAWLVRRLGRGRLIWSVAASGILVISFAGALSGVAPHDRVRLMALHMVTGTVVIVGGMLAARSVGAPASAPGRLRIEAGTRGR